MNHPLGTSRTIVKERYALFSPDGFVPSTLPGWSGCRPNVLISPALGADFVQLNVAFEKGARASGETEHDEMFVYVVAGKCSAVIANKKHSLGVGGYAFVPPETAYEFASQQKGTRLLVFQKYREPIDGHDAPGPLIGTSSEIKGAPFLGNPRALL
ncbi:MAG: hypothetical protein M3O82_01760 [Verrucomicrobiota bacterium]|nr:hypothetical protein [Verrucomicrobiota bacterium]